MLDKNTLPRPHEALPGRDSAMRVPETHFVNSNPMQPPLSDSMREVVFGMGCFWGAERIFWEMPGVFVTAAGYAGGHTPNPTYEEVCSGRTGHAEVVRVIFNTAAVKFEKLLRIFWESHDPTQGMRQGNDRGTQYRSAIYTSAGIQLSAAGLSRDAYQHKLSDAGYGKITTEIRAAPRIYYAETYHQQYLAKNPGGYCGIGGTGVTCPVGLPDTSD